jgi:hypothetical protein
MNRVTNPRNPGPPAQGFPILAFVCLLLLALRAPAAVNVLVEAESFAIKGGWVVDPQFVQQMGSPFLLAHGGGKPVTDATTSVAFPEQGTYRVWVRTRDWVPTHVDNPGQFKVRVNGVELAAVFGTQSGTWAWQDGGSVTIADTNATVMLHDLTGFDGRCDAIAFTSGSDTPPPEGGLALSVWRMAALGEAADPPQTNQLRLRHRGRWNGRLLREPRRRTIRGESGPHPRPSRVGRQREPGNPRRHARRDPPFDRGRTGHLQLQQSRRPHGRGRCEPRQRASGRNEPHTHAAVARLRRRHQRERTHRPLWTPDTSRPASAGGSRRRRSLAARATAGLVIGRGPSTA